MLFSYYNFKYNYGVIKYQIQYYGKVKHIICLIISLARGRVHFRSTDMGFRNWASRDPEAAKCVVKQKQADEVCCCFSAEEVSLNR